MPDVILETERLILRHWRDTDLAPFAAMNVDAQVMEHFPAPLSREQSDALIDRVKAHFQEHGFGLFALETKSEGAFIGFTGMQVCGPALPVVGDVEIGWRLASAHWRQGYAFEAASACVDWAWRNTDYPRLISFTADPNIPSQNLMRKLGFGHREELDFLHPAIPQGDPLSHHVVFVLDREDAGNG